MKKKLEKIKQKERAREKIGIGMTVKVVSELNGGERVE